MSDYRATSDSSEALVLRYLETNDGNLVGEIVERYRGLVQRLARRYSGLEPFEDLVQVGCLGLINALGLFEPSKGVRFSTYATHLVAGAMKHHLRDKCKIIREPAWLQEIRHRVNKAKAELRQELNREPTDTELAERSEIPVDTIEEVRMTEDVFKVSSISIAASNEGDDESEDLDLATEDREQLGVEESVVLETALGELRELERDVLYHFHFESLNQNEIAKRLNISANYVSHILRQSTAKLRATLAREERNDLVLRRESSADPTEVLDEAMDCYTEIFIRARLDEECHRASCLDSAVGFVRIEFTGLDRLERFYGNEAITGFLRDGAAFLRNSVRRLDLVGRIGATGFGIILPGTGEQVAAVYKRLDATIQNWVRQNCATGDLTIHLGSSFYPQSGRTGRDVFDAADMKPIRTQRAA